jgi:hypothetical protein
MCFTIKDDAKEGYMKILTSLFVFVFTTVSLAQSTPPSFDIVCTQSDWEMHLTIYPQDQSATLWTGNSDWSFCNRLDYKGTLQNTSTAETADYKFVQTSEGQSRLGQPAAGSELMISISTAFLNGKVGSAIINGYDCTR